MLNPSILGKEVDEIDDGEGEVLVKEDGESKEVNETDDGDEEELIQEEDELNEDDEIISKNISSNKEIILNSDETKVENGNNEDIGNEGHKQIR